MYCMFPGHKTDKGWLVHGQGFVRDCVFSAVQILWSWLRHFDGGGSGGSVRGGGRWCRARRELTTNTKNINSTATTAKQQLNNTRTNKTAALSSPEIDWACPRRYRRRSTCAMPPPAPRAKPPTTSWTPAQRKKKQTVKKRIKPWLQQLKTNFGT